MDHSVAVAGVSAAAFLGNFTFTMFEHVCGGKCHHKVDRILEQVTRRFAEGELPQNGHLEHAFCTALGQATRVLAYHLHDPMRDLLSKLSMGDFLHRFAEIGQNNILAGTPRDCWLATLIDKSKDPKNYEHDFSLKILLNDHQITRLLSDETDAEFRAHMHLEFLAWVEKHVPDNGHRPIDFAERVEKGWPGGRREGPTLAFYDMFCLFFRELLKEETAVFRAFSANVLTGLSQAVEEIKAALPDATAIQRFTDTLRDFEEKDFDANYSRFKRWTRKQNEKLYDYLRSEFTRVHEHLKVQDSTLDNIQDTTSVHRLESIAGISYLRRYGKLLATGFLLLFMLFGCFWWQHNRQFRDIRARLEAAQIRDAPGSALVAEFRRRLDAMNYSASMSGPDQRVAKGVQDKNLL
jgi:hypothetical protein